MEAHPASAVDDAHGAFVAAILVAALAFGLRLVGAIGVGLALVALFLLSWTPQNFEDYESLFLTE